MDKERILNYAFFKIMIDFINGSFKVLKFSNFRLKFSL
jgi:hypothetical protein